MDGNAKVVGSQESLAVVGSAAVAVDFFFSNVELPDVEPYCMPPLSPSDEVFWAIAQ